MDPFAKIQNLLSTRLFCIGKVYTLHSLHKQNNMTNEQVALQEAVKYFTTYFSAKFQNEETRTVLDIASIFNEHLYKMRNDYENTLKSNDNEK